ncbi:MAG: hypothetical protein HOP07_08165 [Bacteriovoracaceae bacterium]|nr:hypothetical protein [Bacteriovoracaceae bacterium]
MPKFITILLLSAFHLHQAFGAIDLNDVENKLKTTGLTGEIHGANSDSSLFVLTVRDPNDFFTNMQIPLSTESDDVKTKLKDLKRHQYYTVKGAFFDNKAPIKHINVSSLDLARDYKSELDRAPYEYKTKIEDLKTKKEFIGRIHAMAEEGKVLVMEYGDQIVPIVVTEPATQLLVKEYYRGDLVKVKIAVRNSPDAPLHVMLARQGTLNPQEKPIELIESLVRSHNLPIEKTGVLVKFPKSPQIMFNIYALLVEDPEGSTVQYTLVNFENPEVFKATREKLEKLWNDNLGSEENNRNKLINRKVVIKARGISNMVDQGQANPQILINSVLDIDQVK